MPEGIPPSSTSIPGRLEAVVDSDGGGWRRLDIVELVARHGKIEGRDTATKGLANEWDSRVGFASVTKRTMKWRMRCATVISLDVQASHDECDLVDTESWV